MNTSGHVICLNRNAHFFATQGGLAERLEKEKTIVYLAPDQLLHPEEVGAFIVRRGKLRVSQFLEDGLEVTRAVLQAGSVLKVRPAQDHGDNPAADVYKLPEVVLMALSETELWSLPLASLDTDN